MKYSIFRNYTIEPFFKEQNATFSGYEDISFKELALIEAGIYSEKELYEFNILIISKLYYIILINHVVSRKSIRRLRDE